MAFFGLTSLGPQNHFTALDSNQPTLHLFTEEDWLVAWKKVGGEDYIPFNKLSPLLDELHRGPAPMFELERMRKKVGGGKGKDVSWVTLREAFLRIQSEAITEQQSTSNIPCKERPSFTSCHEYRESIMRHNVGNRNSKHSQAITSNQSYGWKKGDADDGLGIIPHKIRGKKSCPETMYASELIKSGFIY